MFPSHLSEGYSIGGSKVGVVHGWMLLLYYPVVLTQLYLLSAQTNFEIY